MIVWKVSMWIDMEKQLVLILVVVAKIQVRLLKAEEGKVSKATVFGLGLVVSEGKP